MNRLSTSQSVFAVLAVGVLSPLGVPLAEAQASQMQEPQIQPAPVQPMMAPQAMGGPAREQPAMERSTTGQPAATPLVFTQLSGVGGVPPRLQLKSLGKGWQRLNLDSEQDDAYSRFFLSRFGGAFQDALSDAGVGVYYTKGQSVKMGNETFLVAYRLDTNFSPNEIQALFRNMDGHGNNSPQQGPRKFPPDTTLRLSLLNLRAVGNLKDVRPFNPSRDMMGPRDITEASDANLRQLGTLLTQVTRLRGSSVQHLPLQDSATLRRTLVNYFHSDTDLFVHPQTKEPYRTNAALTKISMRAVANRAQVVAIYEARPGTDGKYGAVFLDGHTARVPQVQWVKVRAVMPRKPGAAEVRRMSDANLRQLKNQVTYFAQLHGGRLPQMRNDSMLRRDLVGNGADWNTAYFSHPATGEMYRPNALLSGQNLNQITNRARLVVVYEVTPDSDGKRSAIFLDGHLERVSPADWNKVRAVPVALRGAVRRA